MGGLQFVDIRGESWNQLQAWVLEASEAILGVRKP